MLNFNDFDKEFKRTRRFIFTVWIVGATVGLLAFAGLIYVAAHFLAKVW